MLTTSRASRRRLAAGSAAVSLLIAAGLGITASSSSAAEAIKDSVGDALQVAPAAPPEPVAPVATPPLPPVASTNAKEVHKKRVVIVKDGTTTTFEGADADKYIAEHDLPVPPVPPRVAGKPGETVMVMRRDRIEKGKDGLTRAWTVDVPEISSINCPGNATQPVVENSVKDGKHRVVICTNRMEAMTRNAERLAAQSAGIERQAMFTARSSLAMARRSIETDRRRTAEQRAGALAGIAEAEAELRADAKD